MSYKKAINTPLSGKKREHNSYSVKNVTKYNELRSATFRLFNAIKERGGFLIYVGIEKERDEHSHDSKKLYHSVLRETIKRLDQESDQRHAQFVLILDQQEENVLRGEIVETASVAMYGNEPRYKLIEPPVQVESHLYQTVQCADWLCGIYGRLMHYDFEPEEKKEFKIFHDCFHERIKQLALRSSIRPFKKVSPTDDDIIRLQAKFRGKSNS